jgi:hypothetical protein
MRTLCALRFRQVRAAPNGFAKNPVRLLDQELNASNTSCRRGKSMAVAMPNRSKTLPMERSFRKKDRLFSSCSSRERVSSSSRRNPLERRAKVFGPARKHFSSRFRTASMSTCSHGLPMVELLDNEGRSSVKLKRPPRQQRISTKPSSPEIGPVCACMIRPCWSTTNPRRLRCLTRKHPLCRAKQAICKMSNNSQLPTVPLNPRQPAGTTLPAANFERNDMPRTI